MNEQLGKLKLDEDSLHIRETECGPVFAALKLLCTSDKILYDHMLKTQKSIIENPRSVKMTFFSKEFWNKILECFKNHMIQTIVTEINENGKQFGIQVDTTPDNRKKEQVSVVVKYVVASEEKGFVVNERTIVFRPIIQATGKGMFDFVISNLSKYGLDIKNATGKCILFTSSCRLDI